MAKTLKRPASSLFSTRRLEALTDGVFAIAMTLLVLDLSVDALGHVTTSVALYQGLRAMTANIVSFFVAFLLLASMWGIHTRQFEYIKRTDKHLMFLNNLRLLAVVLIPLTTSISATYSSLLLGRVLLPVNFFVLATISAVQWKYAIDPKNKLYDTMPDDVRDYSISILTVYQSIFVVIASIWIGNVAFLIFAFTPLLVKLSPERKEKANSQK